MIVRIFKVIVGILLIPVTVAVSQAFTRELVQIQSLGALSGYFLKGVIVYLIMHLILYKPTYFYVFGHETAHAIATLLCGGQVGSFHVSKRGGAVSTSKSNFFIALFPYFFPTYTLLFWLVYFIASLFTSVSTFTPALLFLMGFSLTMHLIMTIDSMKIKQSDIFKTGYIFSVSLIYVLNIALISSIISVVFKSFSFKNFFDLSARQSAHIYQAIYKYLFL